MEYLKALASNSYVLLVLAILPGIFYLYLYYSRDKFRKEPVAVVIKTFLWGAGITIPIGLFQTLFPGEQMQGFPPFFALYMILIVGFTEELGKWLVTRYYAFRNEAFDEVTDGIVYGASAAGGFAVLENIFYVMEHGFSTAVLRAVLSVPGHMFWGAISGYWLAMYKFGGVSRGKMLWKGLFFVAVAHGLFNTFLSYGITILLAPAIIVWCGLLTKKYYRLAIEHDQKYLSDELIVEETEIIVKNSDGSIAYRKDEIHRLSADSRILKVSSLGFALFGWILLGTGILVVIGVLGQMDDKGEIARQNIINDVISAAAILGFGLLSIFQGRRLKKKSSTGEQQPSIAGRIGGVLLMILGVISMGLSALVILGMTVNGDFSDIEKVSENLVIVLLMLLFSTGCIWGGLRIFKRNRNSSGQTTANPGGSLLN